MIKVYSMDGCPYCKELKERLDKMGIQYQEIDINLEENAAEFERIVEITGNDYLPMVLVGNDMLIPDTSFKTIEECANTVKNLLNG